MKRLLVHFCFVFVAAGVGGITFSSSIEAASSLPGPQTAEVPYAEYQRLIYVSCSTGSDENGLGTQARPWKTIQRALSQTEVASATNRTAILVAAGTYREPTIAMCQHVDLYGGFDSQRWQRDIFGNETVLDGGDQRRILSAASHAILDGFVLRQGKVRGPGGAILCQSCSPTITNNRFVDNLTEKPKNWSPEHFHEHAHDGAAISCVDRASPIIRHNLFSENRTEIGRGAAIAMHGHCTGEIVGCVFLDNATGMEDQDRSSDGGAVSIFDWSSPRIENNVFLENKSFNSNDGGALFVALWSSPVIEKNVFVGNRSTDDGGALFIGGQEHRYDQPDDPVPPREKYLVVVTDNLFLGNENNKHNSGGMRITMQARATLQGNFLGRDAILYVQESEAVIANNTILEDTILRELPEGAAGDLAANNLLGGRLLVDKQRRQRAKKEKNAKKTNQQKHHKHFLEDNLPLQVTASNYFPGRHVTEIQVTADDLEENGLANRAARFARRWGVVRSNHDDLVTVWGDVTDYGELVVMPAFRVDASSLQE